MLQNNNSETGLAKLLPLGLTTLTNHKGTWVYVRDMEFMKSTFEMLHPGFSLEFLQGPCLYFYQFCVVPTNTKKAKKLKSTYRNKRLNK